jgi:hypothetical protein
MSPIVLPENIITNIGHLSTKFGIPEDTILEILDEANRIAYNAECNLQQLYEDHLYGELMSPPE